MPALESERPSLARDGFLAAVAFAMGLLLTLVFPTTESFNRRTDSLPASAYAEAYLAVLARANPQDGATRLAWVRQLAARGDFAKALRELEEVARLPAWKPMADDLGVDLAWAAARSQAEGSEARRHALADVARRLEVLLEGTPRAARWNTCASLALEIERPALAARFYEGMAGASEGQARADAWGATGRWYLAVGQGKRAAPAFEEAARAAPDDAEASAWINESLAAREAAGDTADAAEAAWKWTQLRRRDASLLAHAAQLASAANQPGRARDLGRSLLLLEPHDGRERERQALRELAAGDPVAAWPLIEEAVKRRPDSVEWRIREAEVAEWTGHPQIALNDWLLLSRRGRQRPRMRGSR